jgi:hypothetical protein
MSYKVICKEDNYEKNFSDCIDAQLAYNRHARKGHAVSMVPIPPSTYETYEECLKSKGAFNGAFRIYQKPLGFTLSMPTGGNFARHKSILADDSEIPQASPKNDKYNFYFERLVKLIPSEIVGLYLALYATITTANGIEDKYANLIFFGSFILVFISRLFGTKVTGYNTLSYFKTAQWWSIGISAISFVIWVLAMGHKIPFFGDVDQTLIKILVIFWTFIIPMVYKGEK